MAQLGLSGAAGYRARLESDPTEWNELDACCRVTISRFYRDRAVFDHLRQQLLPELAGAAVRRGDSTLRVWSAGCASGEEPYSLSITWGLEIGPRFPMLRLEILATDVSNAVLERARVGRYPRSSVSGLPQGWIDRAFTLDDGTWMLRPEHREPVHFRKEDIRQHIPEGLFHLVLCRNLVFTYFATPLQERLLGEIARILIPGGALVVGVHEVLPAGSAGLLRATDRLPIHRLPITAVAGAS